MVIRRTSLSPTPTRPVCPANPLRRGTTWTPSTPTCPPTRPTFQATRSMVYWTTWTTLSTGPLLLRLRYKYHERGATSQLIWTRRRWISRKRYVCSKRPNRRGPSDSLSRTSPTLLVRNGTSRSRVLLVGASASSSLLPSPAGRYYTDHHGRRQQLEPAVTHQRPPGQPRGITESSTEPEIDAVLPKIVISELTTRSAGNMEPPLRTWQRGMYIPTHGPNNFPSGRPCRRRRGRTYSAQRHQNWPRLARPEGCCDIRPYLCDGRGLD